jgi:predicted lipoprotein with Yx(FWY)xxD motif
VWQHDCEDQLSRRAFACAPRRAAAAETGEVVRADNIGLPLYTYNFDKKVAPVVRACTRSAAISSSGLS